MNENESIEFKENYTEEIYNANYYEELIKEIIEVKDKCFEYNNIKPSNIEGRTKLLKEILEK